MKLSKNKAGLEAERIATTFLLDHSLKLAAKNYHCKFGEIDLIVNHPDLKAGAISGMAKSSNERDQNPCVY